ncbi:MAG TPA: hypothetical protein VFP32_03140 [Candidatus Saccharimonadales bacterium]|nr:hypothetical protein [Candidatus Saccharimonadales bacterium]
MKTPVAKRLSWLGLTAIYSTALLVSFTGSSYASSCPGDLNPTCQKSYIKVTGGDVSTGGWFNNGQALCPTSTTPVSNYQDSNFSNPPEFPADSENRYGGIITNANLSGNNSAGGSSSEFAAYALGEIMGNSSGVGFYSGGGYVKSSGSAQRYDYLSYANTMGPSFSMGSDFWGGNLVPSTGVRQTSYCIPDYYKNMMPDSTPPILPSGKLNDPAAMAADGTYSETATGDPLDIVPSADLTIPAGRHVRVFVKGSVYIGHNITYAGHTANQVPKFTLIVQGSIYISKDVTRLDGFYVAQPDPTDSDQVGHDTGDIWTCHDDSTTIPIFAGPGSPAECTNHLVVNGAFVAKSIQLYRVGGAAGFSDAAGATTAEDGFANAPNSNASEVINYSPDMVMGGPFSDQTSDDNNIDSLISLPPVY